VELLDRESWDALDRITEDQQTTLERGVRFKGVLESSHTLVVRGRVEGEVHAPALVVTETGSVEGTIHVQSLDSTGLLAGHVEADDILLGGRVQNDTFIRARTLAVQPHDGASGEYPVRLGDCTLEVGADPADPGQLASIQTVHLSGGPRDHRGRDEASGEKIV